MADKKPGQDLQPVLIRILWMIVFVIAWSIGEIVLAAVVIGQLLVRIICGQPNDGLLRFGDSLSQYMAEIGRFGTFNTEEKPWPFSDWPVPRSAQPEQPEKKDEDVQA